MLTRVSVGRYCSIAEDVTIGPTEHPTDRISTHLFSMGTVGPFGASKEYAAIVAKAGKTPMRGTTVGNDVWIGAGAFIRRGLTIGDGAIIGARAVVTKDVPAYSIVGGVPAEIIRKRFDDFTTQRLLNLQWWKYDLRPLQKSADFTDIENTLCALEKLLLEDKLEPLEPQTTVLKRTR